MTIAKPGLKVFGSVVIDSRDPPTLTLFLHLLSLKNNFIDTVLILGGQNCRKIYVLK